MAARIVNVKYCGYGAGWAADAHVAALASNVKSFRNRRFKRFMVVKAERRGFGREKPKESRGYIKAFRT